MKSRSTLLIASAVVIVLLGCADKESQSSGLKPKPVPRATPVENAPGWQIIEFDELQVLLQPSWVESPATEADGDARVLKVMLSASNSSESTITARLHLPAPVLRDSSEATVAATKTDTRFHGVLVGQQPLLYGATERTFSGLGPRGMLVATAEYVFVPRGEYELSWPLASDKVAVFTIPSP